MKGPYHVWSNALQRRFAGNPSGADTAVRVWDVRSLARPMRTLEGHDAAVLSVGQVHLEHCAGPVVSFTAVRRRTFLRALQ